LSLGGERRSIELNPAGRNLRDVWTIPTHSFPEAHFATFPPALVERPIQAGTSERGCCATCGAPWERVTGRRFSAHDGATDTLYPEGTTANRLALLRQAARRGGAEYSSESQTLGWQPTCSCFTDPCPRCGKPWREVEVYRAVSTMNVRLRDRVSGSGDPQWHEGAEESATPRDGEKIETTKARLPTCFCGLIPCTVLDPFTGSGTTGVVALELGRRFIGIEANPLYAKMAEERIAESLEGKHPVAVVAVGLEEFL